MRTLTGDTPLPAAADGFAAACALLRSRPSIDVKHSGTTLIAHLEGVERKLAEWQCRSALRLAGLFHSVYSTEFFRQQTIPIADRGQVRDVIGAEAEELAYRYCTLNTRIFQAEVANLAASLQPSSEATSGSQAKAIDPALIDLLHIFVANWLEQFPRTRSVLRVRHAAFLRKVRPLLVPLAAEEVEALYQFDTLPAPRSVTLRVAAPGREAGEVTVLDDFVPQHLQHELSSLMERNIWRYGWKSAGTQTGSSLWHSHFAGDNDKNHETDCAFELADRPLVAPVLALWHLIRETLVPGHIAVRMYANGATFGSDGHIHDDSKRPGHFTSLYYAHAHWDANWAGETLFFNADGTDIVRSVFPKPGRLIHFNGNILHAARSPARECPVLRSVIVIKTFCPPQAG